MDPERIERLIDQGRDSYEARLAAGQARLKRGEIAQAVDHLLRATEQDEGKTIAWQSLGEAYRSRGQIDEARAAWKRGIEVAAANGDSQAEKVMTVWLKRLDKLPSLLDPKAVFSEDRLIVLPTETVYGLAAPIDRPDLIARVFELNVRPADH
ncbi:MAG: Sua5/YciO/YrdC/YwlC family protein, partial [Pseudomonadota bacterium]